VDKDCFAVLTMTSLRDRVGGFSVGNLWLMAQFYNEYHAIEFLVPVVREISWRHRLLRCAYNDEFPLADFYPSDARFKEKR